MSFTVYTILLRNSSLACYWILQMANMLIGQVILKSESSHQKLDVIFPIKARHTAAIYH